MTLPAIWQEKAGPAQVMARPSARATVLRLQFLHGRPARAGNGLVRGDITPRRPTASCSGLSASTNWAVEQFGLAMIPLCPRRASALTSGTTKRHIGAHPEVRAVVNHHRAAPDRFRAERDRRALLALGPGEQGNVNAVKRLRRGGLDFMGNAIHMDGARRPGQNLNALRRETGAPPGRAAVPRRPRRRQQWRRYIQT